MANIKVLCAEDDRLMRLEMKEKMTAKGWEVIEAANGEEAFVIYKECRPDVVILDVDMPKRSGLEVLQLIRINDLQTPVVIYSSLTEEKDLKNGLYHGAQVYLIKNYSVALLLEQIERLIGRTASSVVKLTDNVTYDFAKAELCIGEQRQKLTMLESKVFAILCKNKNRLSPREVLLLAGWNSTAYNYESQLNKVIRKLRKLLMRENQVKIILDKGNGYWLKTEEGYTHLMMDNCWD